MKGKIYEIYIGDLDDELPYCPTLLFYKVTSEKKEDSDKIDRFCKLMFDKILEMKFVSEMYNKHHLSVVDMMNNFPWTFVHGFDAYIKKLENLNPYLRPRFQFLINKNKLEEFLQYINKLEIKSDNCKIKNEPLGL